jgi:hypothetical protein
MLKDDISDKRKERHHITQEDFTPVEVCRLLYKNIDKELYYNFNKTLCDVAAGTGNIIRFLLKERLNYCQTFNDIKEALGTIYGVELMEDNVEECYKLIIKDIKAFANSKKIVIVVEEILDILKNNIVCSNTFDWDFVNWKTKIKQENALF